MLIVDGQIHLWDKGTPSTATPASGHILVERMHRQDGRQAGVDRAPSPPGAIGTRIRTSWPSAAVAKYPDRFRHHGLVLARRLQGGRTMSRTGWSGRGWSGLRFYFNDRHPREWVTDGRLDWLWPAAEKAGVPINLAAALFLPTVGQDRRAPPRPQTDRRPHGRPTGAAAAGIRLPLPARAAGARQAPQRRGQGDRPDRLRRGRLPVPQLSR